MRIDVSEMMTDSDFGAEQFVRMRPTTSVAHEGEGETQYSQKPITGIVQAAATSDAKLLEEGVRLSDVQAFFCADDLSAGDGSKTLPDLLKHKGITYRVLHVQDFRNNGMVKALAQKLAV